jgi:Cu(I)/Ag(I) efflux system membrane fusion protein/cobalt-zinc-cadmium efflux system membrane fusion protein
MIRTASRRLTAIGICAAFAAGIAAGWFLYSRGTPPRAPHERYAARTEAKVTTWYTCGMHPEVVEGHPGDCPKCGMKLQPMSPDRAVAMGLAKPEEGATPKPAGKRQIAYWKSSMIPGELHMEPGKDSMGMDLIPVYEDEVATAATIRIDPVTEQNMGVRVAEVIRGPLTKAVRTVAFVDYDETTLAVVTTKVDGWVEKLYVSETGVQVHRGDPLFELYSPALFSAQEEYLAAIRNRQQTDVAAVPRSRLDSEALVRSARTRLEYFDVSSEQITQLERTGRVRKSLTIRAPFTGIVVHKGVVEGQMIKAGVDIFRIADLSTVWVMGKVFEHDLPYVRLGQEAFMTLSYLPGRTFRGRVTYVYPYLEAATREVPVRMEFHNPGYNLKPGMYATVTLTSEAMRAATLVPDTAVINTGLRSVAFVMRKPGQYEPREVRVGLRGENNYLQVLSGLAPGEMVVVSGQFLLDSESRLREAALKFMAPGRADGAAPITAAAETPEEGTAGVSREASLRGSAKLVYVCPMPGHVDILYDNPGTCPLCGMKLVPVKRRAGHVDAPRIVHWTCPMPGHAAVQEAGPGKCPICSMSLVPVEERAGQVEETHETHWTCPMPEHAAVQEAGPGKCPICGMSLVPVEERAGQAEETHGTHWTCPMPEHAAVQEAGPGKCSICGMSLLPVTEGQGGQAPVSAHKPVSTEHAGHAPHCRRWRPSSAGSGESPHHDPADDRFLTGEQVSHSAHDGVHRLRRVLRRHADAPRRHSGPLGRAGDRLH